MDNSLAPNKCLTLFRPGGGGEEILPALTLNVNDFFCKKQAKATKLSGNNLA